MDIRQLRYFVQTADDKSYRIASEKLYLSPPALFAAIKQLEQDIGAALFNYTNKQLLLTPDGRDLYERAVKILMLHSDTINFFLEKKTGHQGCIRVGISQLFATCFFAPAITDFIKEYPDIILNFHESGSVELQKMVMNDELDIGFVVSPLFFETSNFSIYPIPNTEHTKVLICNKDHRLADRKTISYADVKEDHFLMLNDDFTFMTALRNDSQKAGFTPNVTMRSSLVDFIVEVIGNSDLVTILPSIFVKKYNSDRIRVLNIKENDYNANVCIVTQPGYNYKPGEVFIAQMQKIMQKKI